MLTHWMSMRQLQQHQCQQRSLHSTMPGHTQRCSHISNKIGSTPLRMVAAATISRSLQRTQHSSGQSRQQQRLMQVRR